MAPALTPRACLMTGKMFTASHPGRLFVDQAAAEANEAAGHRAVVLDPAHRDAVLAPVEIVSVRDPFAAATPAATANSIARTIFCGVAKRLRSFRAGIFLSCVRARHSASLPLCANSVKAGGSKAARSKGGGPVGSNRTELVSREGF